MTYAADKLEHAAVAHAIEVCHPILPAGDELGAIGTISANECLSAIVPVGTNGNDVLRGTNGKDVIIGKGGNDVIIGKGGNDVLKGGAGKDKLKGGGGNDKILAGTGNDTALGGNGNDKLKGGSGKDLLVGDKGSDHFWGGSGRDIFKFKKGDGGPLLEIAPPGTSFDDVIFDYVDGIDRFDIPGPTSTNLYDIDPHEDPVGGQGSFIVFAREEGVNYILKGSFFVTGYSAALLSDSDFV